MHKSKFITLAFCAATALTGCQVDADANGVQDWCISGGPIYAANASNSIYQALAVKDGRISYTGDASGTWCADNSLKAKLIDLDGAALYPGLTDGHGP